MKKVIATSILAITLCLTLIPVKANAQWYDAGAGISKTRTHKTTTQNTPWQRSTNIKSTTKGAFVSAHVDGPTAGAFNNIFYNNMTPCYRPPRQHYHHPKPHRPPMPSPGFRQPSFPQPAFGF